MRHVPDDTPITRLTLPGSHDSAAHSVWSFSGVGFARTQDLDLDQQLRAGCRFLDLRCRHFADRLIMHHGCIDLYQSFDDVMETISEYLTRHPSEFLVICLMEEYEAGGDNQIHFAQCVEQHLGPYSHLFYRAPDGDDRTLPPSLGAARGKIVLFRRFGLNAATATLPSIELCLHDGARFGEHSCGPDLKVVYNNYYQCSSADDKIANVDEALTRAMQSSDPTHLHLIGTSGFCLSPWYNISTPAYFAAVVNRWLTRKLETETAVGGATLGIVSVDFINLPLARALVRTNFAEALGNHVWIEADDDLLLQYGGGSVVDACCCMCCNCLWCCCPKA